MAREPLSVGGALGIPEACATGAASVDPRQRVRAAGTAHPSLVATGWGGGVWAGALAFPWQTDNSGKIFHNCPFARGRPRWVEQSSSAPSDPRRHAMQKVTIPVKGLKINTPG
jgi:hypothetical protein